MAVRDESRGKIVAIGQANLRQHAAAIFLLANAQEHDRPTQGARRDVVARGLGAFAFARAGALQFGRIHARHADERLDLLAQPNVCAHHEGIAVHHMDDARGHGTGYDVRRLEPSRQDGHREDNERARKGAQGLDQGAGERIGKTTVGCCSKLA